MLELEHTEIVQRTIRPLAKFFNISPERAREIWESEKNNSDLEDYISRFKDPKIRGRVNKWWGEYRNRLLSSLGVCNTSFSTSKFPESTYKQIMCLVWLTGKFKEEQFLQKHEKPRIRKPKSGWQRFVGWVKSFFKK